ncbi:hypothetical protein H5410_027525 [Solanum commersonii]|uniref:Uncharacterized protein n=1 Tax=Solanum commersonii TaxID=4109 RepID=A0A9J5YZF3_SOLCO|nr:hypothetical protein H5410_027525 [Solanum commersonii]
MHLNYNSSQDHHQQQPYRSNKGKGKVANVHGQPAVDVSDKGKGLAIQNEDQTVSLTKEEYERMMHLLRHAAPIYDNQRNTSVVTSNSGPATITPSYSQNDGVPETQPTQPQRRSTRTHKAPTYLLDYVCPTPKATTCSTPLSLSSLFCRHSHIAPDVLALTSQHLVNNIIQYTVLILQNCFFILPTMESITPLKLNIELD